VTWIHIPTIESSICSPDTEGSRSASDWPDSIPLQLPTSNGTPSARKSSSNGSGTNSSTMLPSGTTLKVSTGDPGVDAWILSQEASPANRIALQGNGPGQMTTGTSGPIRSDSLAKFDPLTSSWKMFQACWQMETGQPMLESLSGSWPQSGMTRSGELYPLPKLERHTSASGGGLWPTPTSTERSGTNPKTGKGEGLSKTVKMLPTPRASEYKGSGPVGSKSHTHMLKRDYLCAVVKMLPTPKGTDWKGSGISQKAIDREAAHFNLWGVVTKLNQSGGGTGGDVAPELIGGSLSPDWVSWLMGLPVGWTSLEPMPRREYLDWLHAQLDGTWWDEERGLPRVTTGAKDRVNRLKCLGNGIVPASLALFLRR
jgi:hypothetical protein